MISLSYRGQRALVIGSPSIISAWPQWHWRRGLRTRTRPVEDSDLFIGGRVTSRVGGQLDSDSEA